VDACSVPRRGIRHGADGRSGFNYGRRLSEPDLSYLPGDIGLYYEAGKTTLRVVRVVNAKRLRNLP